MVPKLVAEDIPLLFSLLSDVFPGVQYHRGEMTALREELKKVCQEMYLTYGDGEEVGGMWVEKVTGVDPAGCAVQSRQRWAREGATFERTRAVRAKEYLLYQDLTQGFSLNLNVDVTFYLKISHIWCCSFSENADCSVIIMESIYAV